MATDFELNAEIRSDKGKGASRRLRRADKVPAILYGGNAEPQPLMLQHHELMHALENEAFYSHVLTINVGDKSEKAVLKDVQRHPAKPRIQHIDLQRVSETAKLHMHVPLHFINEDIAPGVKVAGGLVSHHMTDVEVTCLPKHLPEFVEVDLATLELNQSIHVSELILPEGVELVTHGGGQDQPVVSIGHARGVVEEEEEEAAVAEEGGEAPAPEGEG